ncbi:unnamed protein product [Meganyctiphanes norvegica]|uniref:Chitin-binding type-2 domain-containing protein n=1 Tax=Meganyctiphanes norvegica TaxID=48144 RepID=A0AAV2R3L1_MEGNR
MTSSVLQYLVTLTCFVLVTGAAVSQSYRSIKAILLNRSTESKLPEQCLPTCQDDNGNHTAMHIRDPSRCDQYWICLPDGTLYEQPHVCPDGWIVNSDKLVCEPINEESEQCIILDPECDPSIPKVCYRKDTCPDRDEGIFPYADEDDCVVYHACHFADVDIKCDPATPYFNGQECVDDANQCCNCQAVCDLAWTFIPDPFDCHSYYLCQDLNSSIVGGKEYIATDEEKFTCPEGEAFNASISLCSVPAEPCVPKCGV